MKKDAVFYHIHQFSLKHKLYEKDSSILLGLSAGMDSMFLLHFFLHAKKRSWIHALRAIYVNHGLRPQEAKEEEEFLTKFCEKNGIELQLVKVDFCPDRNIEQVLRNRRYQLLKNALNVNEKLALGHHLNDSFEWSLRQSLRSSNLFASLGIPVKNGVIIRPLLCISKKQIRYFINDLKILFKDDSSNQDLKFERNFLRQKIIIPLERRFPGYLKHYVSRQESLLDLSLKEKSFKLMQNNYGVPFLIRLKPDDSAFEKKNQLIYHLKKMSNTERGVWDRQLDKFLLLVNSPHPKGPMTLSGGIYLYSLGLNLALISRQKLSTSLRELRLKFSAS